MIRSCIAALLFALSSGCADGATNPPAPADTSLTVSPPALDLGIGERAVLEAVLAVNDTGSVTVAAEWTSRDPAIVSVTSAGLVTALASGTTRVVAAFRNQVDSASVTVRTDTVAPPGLQLVTDGLSQPVYATSPPGDSTRLFVVEKGGTIRVLRNDTLLATPFLDIGALVTNSGEQGLLSMAFHPDYVTNGYVFLSYTDTLGDSRVIRYHASGPETADPTSAFPILSVDQPYSNHNGGLVAFGPDGMLYVGLGDGGSGGDPQGNGQNTGTLLGAILRLDVDGGSPYAVPADNPLVGVSGARGEIWVYGLRNPWRFSFDRLTGDLYIGDVGQSAREEVDVQTATSNGGENYGWNVMEGMICYNAATCQTQGLTLPVIDYPHTEGCSITGGYVYRGNAVALLQGRYLYADYCQGWVRSFTWSNGQAGDERAWPDLAPGGSVSSFGKDAAGELYIMTLGGELYRIVEE